MLQMPVADFIGSEEYTADETSEDSLEKARTYQLDNRTFS